MARISLTAAQVQAGPGAELFSLCQGITEDGKLSKDEVVALGRWLRIHRHSPLPAVAVLTATLDRIVADGRVTREESQELLECLEKVLPPAYRKTARAARMAVKAERAAGERAVRSELKERRRPAEWFDFMVAGAGFEGRDALVRSHLRQGTQVRIALQPANPHDADAVAMTLGDGRMFGYVPRAEAAAVGRAMRRHPRYYATVKKLLAASDHPIPVIVLRFYREDQAEAIRDRDLLPCDLSPFPLAPRGRPWWKVW